MTLRHKPTAEEKRIIRECAQSDAGFRRVGPVMSKQHVTITLPVEEAEPILRRAAHDAAKYGAICDYVTRHTMQQPSWLNNARTFADAQKEWSRRFLKAKRMVEVFGVEYEQTSEGETLTVAYEHIGGKTKVVDMGEGIGKVGWTTGSKPDYDHPKPAYRMAVHDEACHQAAERVIRKWRAALAA